LIFVLFVFLIVYTLGDVQDTVSIIWTGFGGIILVALLVFMDIRLHHRRTGQILSGLVGMILGLLLAKLISNQFADPIFNYFGRSDLSPLGLIVLSMIMGYAGILVGKGSMGELRIFNTDMEEGGRRLMYLLDLDSLVDGRIVTLCKTPVLPGEILVPRFVVDSLESMSAAGDQVMRFRGKRGIENLRSMEREQDVRLFVRGISTKTGQENKAIMEYAREHGATIITKDADLDKLASKNNVSVINFNTLAEQLAPEVLQGDELVIKLVKPGKEPDQAVGYLENGNMVVVENSRKEIGKTVRIIVTGIHQTKAGTLVFAQLKD
jgi:uncharacterized protein YacL